MVNNGNVFKTLQKHYDIVENLGYNIIGVFLYGSQNYKLDYDESDIDSKAIIIPSLHDIVLGKKLISTTITTDKNEQIDLKDIRIMFDNLKKQNINYIETLFTEYKILNKDFSDIINPLFENNELIARYDEKKALNCMAGMVLEKYKALEYPYPTTKEKIEKYGYDGKQLHHIIRIAQFMTKYINGEKYSDCLIADNRENLISIKRDNNIPLGDARILAKNMSESVYLMKNDYLNNTECTINTEVDDLLENIVLNVFEKHFFEEMNRTHGGGKK